MPRLLHHISVRYPNRLPWDLIDALPQGPVDKNGKYEYCHLFSNSQNCPKRPHCGLDMPSN